MDSKGLISLPPLKIIQENCTHDQNIIKTAKTEETAKKSRAALGSNKGVFFMQISIHPITETVSILISIQADKIKDRHTNTEIVVVCS